MLKLFFRDHSQPLSGRDRLHKVLLIPAAAAWCWVGITFLTPKQSEEEEPFATAALVTLSFGATRRSWQVYHRTVSERAMLWPWRFWLFHTGSHLGIYFLLTTAFWPTWGALLVGYWLSGKLLPVFDEKLPIQQGFAGRVLKTYWQTKRYYEAMRDKNHEGYLFGGLLLPPKQLAQNVMFLGGVGSGKTISIRFLMQSILPRITENSGLRLITYDAKRDMLSIVRGMNADCPLWILNPFDARCAAPELASVITSPTHARNLATTLAPKDAHDKDPIWIQLTQMMLEGITLYFILNAPGQWGLRDIILACESIETLSRILASDERTVGYLLPLQGEKMTHSMMVNTQAHLSKYRVIAALWEHAAHKIDLAEFLKREGILVLPRDEECETEVNALNKLIMLRLSQMLLNGDESPTPHTFFILDEFTSLSAIPAFQTLATNGRSKGVSLTVAFQSWPDLVNTYNHNVANTIAEQFWYKGIFRLNGAETAQWASQQIGRVERNRRSAIDSRLGTMNPLEQTTAILPADFMTLPPPDIKLKQGVTGYFLGHWAYRYTLPSKTISQYLAPKDSEFADFIPMPLEHQYLQPWDASDLARLNLTNVLGNDQVA